MEQGRGMGGNNRWHRRGGKHIGGQGDRIGGGQGDRIGGIRGSDWGDKGVGWRVFRV